MTFQAVFFDALGTLVELDPPAVHLAASLGLEPDDPRVVAAIRSEIGYYRDHAHEATDEASLADLRAACARLLSRRLGREVGIEMMMASIRFHAYDDAAPALTALRDRGLALVCVSNWDVSLPAVLERCCLADRLDGVVTSAGARARKPNPAIFAPALALAGCDPARALHVGDSPNEDIAGARAAGIRSLLIGREGGGQIASLAEIEQHLEL